MNTKLWECRYSRVFLLLSAIVNSKNTNISNSKLRIHKPLCVQCLDEFFTYLNVILTNKYIFIRQKKPPADQMPTIKIGIDRSCAAQPHPPSSYHRQRSSVQPTGLEPVSGLRSPERLSNCCVKLLHSSSLWCPRILAIPLVCFDHYACPLSLYRPLDAVKRSASEIRGSLQSL